MEELEKTARDLILAITEKTLKSLKDKGLLKKPSNLQILCTSPEMTSLIKKLSSPKYAPCRKFRKGDIVEPCQVKGRWMSDTWAERSGIHYTVTEDEDEYGIITIVKDPDCNLPSIASAVFFKLVTPVEELEPYSVGESTDYFSVDAKDGNEISCYWKDSHPNAKAGAEAERDRLNAEYRKEQSHE